MNADIETNNISFCSTDPNEVSDYIDPNGSARHHGKTCWTTNPNSSTTFLLLLYIMGMDRFFNSRYGNILHPYKIYPSNTAYTMISKDFSHKIYAVCQEGILEAFLKCHLSLVSGTAMLPLCTLPHTITREWKV